MANIWITFLLLMTFHLGPSMADNKCPTACQCTNNNLNVDCSGAKLTSPPKTSRSTLTINLSRNILGPIINAPFPSMSNLTYLDLSHNGIRRLLGCTLKGMLSLNRVSLRGNLLTMLPDSLFADSDDVEHLDFSHNHFDVLPNDVFKNTPNLKTLDLSHNRAVELKLGLRFQVPRHLVYLDLSHNSFETLDNNSFNVAEQWEGGFRRTLNLASCKLNSIESSALSKIPGLYDLDLSGNPDIPTENITSIIAELGRKHLRRVSFAGTNLTSIASFFTEVTTMPLKFLNVSNNQISSLPANTFSTVRSLEVLDISHNKLTTLSQAIKGLINLKVLNMSSNALTAFKCTSSNCLNKVEVLDVSNNRLASVSNVKFRSMIKLKYLNVKTNLLPSVQLPRTTNNLIELDYSSNSIRKFSGFPNNVPKLEKFDISDNDLEELEGLLFKGGQKIKVANFSKNSITKLDPRTFQLLSPIVIDLSHNFLTSLRFTHWKATQEIYLNHNQIGDVDMQTFHQMNGLRVLDMSENNITVLHEDLFDHTSSLEYLNLSSNRLTQAFFELLFRNLRNLRSLDLGRNNMSNLNETMLIPLPNLRKLSVRENQLEVIMPRVFRDLKHMQEIDLSDNPFSCVCDMLALRDWLGHTQIPITGLYKVNSSSYNCHSPSSRVGLHVMKWEPGQFECDDVMLYMIVFGSIGLTLILAGVVSTIVHRLYLRYKRSKTLKRTKVEELLAAEKKRKKGDKKRMTSEEIAEEITNAIERRERKSLRKAGDSKRGNGYVSWPAGKKDAEQVKEGRRGPDVIKDANVGQEKTRIKSPERHYDRLIRTDEAGRMELIDRDRDRRDRGRQQHEYDGRREGRREHAGEYIDVDNAERGHYFNQDRHYRADQLHFHRDDPHAKVPSPSLPPRNRWDTVDVWDRDARRWIIPGQRRSRSQGQRRERDGQRYLTMPIRDQDYHRSRSHDRGGHRPRHHFDHYTNEVRYGVEDMDRYYSGERQSRRDLYENRSRSYHQLPNEYRAAEEGRISPKRFKQDQTRNERQYWMDDRRQLISSRAISQPYLANENASEWL